MHNMTERVGKMKRLLRKLACVVLFICIGFAIPTSETHADDWGYPVFVDLGGDWEMRIDRPAPTHPGSKYHVHVYHKDDEGNKCAENVDGTPSHGTTLDDCHLRIPKRIIKAARNHPEYEKAARKQEKRAERQEFFRRNKRRIEAFLQEWVENSQEWIDDHYGDIETALAVANVTITIAGFVFPAVKILNWASKLGIVLTI